MRCATRVLAVAFIAAITSGGCGAVDNPVGFQIPTTASFQKFTYRATAGANGTYCGQDGEVQSVEVFLTNDGRYRMRYAVIDDGHADNTGRVDCIANAIRCPAVITSAWRDLTDDEVADMLEAFSNLSINPSGGGCIFSGTSCRWRVFEWDGVQAYMDDSLDSPCSGSGTIGVADVGRMMEFFNSLPGA